jgi:hypothetical protein
MLIPPKKTGFTGFRGILQIELNPEKSCKPDVFLRGVVNQVLDHDERSSGWCCYAA